MKFALLKKGLALTNADFFRDLREKAAPGPRLFLARRRPRRGLRHLGGFGEAAGRRWAVFPVSQNVYSVIACGGGRPLRPASFECRGSDRVSLAVQVVTDVCGAWRPGATGCGGSRTLRPGALRRRFLSSAGRTPPEGP